MLGLENVKSGSMLRRSEMRGGEGGIGEKWGWGGTRMWGGSPIDTYIHTCFYSIIVGKCGDFTYALGIRIIWIIKVAYMYSNG